MPLETFHGADPRDILSRARAALGDDAVIVELRRARHGFELVAMDAGGASAAPARPGRPPAPAAILPSPGHADLALAGPARIALVGPSGAGKTTTVAKLLALSRRTGVRAGVLGLDTYRAGAEAQLRALARLERAPLAVAHDDADLAKALRALRRCGTLFVDTPGRGPGRAADDRECWNLVEALRPGEIHLVVPAGLHPARARRLLRDYRARGITHLLVTKLDEHPEETVWFELAAEAQVAQRWVAHGQDLAGGLGPASDWRVGGGARPAGSAAPARARFAGASAAPAGFRAPAFAGAR